MKGKVLSFAAGLALAAGTAFGLVQTDTVQVYDEKLQAEAWCQGFADGTVLMLARMMGIIATPEMLADTQASCLTALADDAEMPSFMAGPVE